METQSIVQTHETCPYCGSTHLQVTVERDSIHWGRVTCQSCGRWVKWIGKPPSEEVLQRGEFIDGLLLQNGLTPWERTFLGSLKNKKTLSPKQQKVFRDISLKYRGRSPP